MEQNQAVMTEFKEICRVCYDEHIETGHVVCKFCTRLLGSVRTKEVRRRYLRHDREPNGLSRPAVEIDNVATVVLPDK